MVGYCSEQKLLDRTAVKRFEKELAAYKSARDQGIQPDGTTNAKIRFAVEQSEKHGMAYGEDFHVIPNEKRTGFDAVSKKQVAEVTSMVDSSADFQVLKETAKAARSNP